LIMRPEALTGILAQAILNSRRAHEHDHREDFTTKIILKAGSGRITALGLALR